ncbi:MAG: Xaa-Pro dipeptidase [Stappia sp.]|uniref:M24 family metallopeptidase n=1 Tax=Stappia sp. TaxID=1870903 RepID=UPI000C54970D|nr:Xaa-Pro peptidase family protein [Stappia sp.]MAB00602.1 Xaa-Pro dipeptidase [Stappia sp.]MBM18672.1 Xaa-Pro dipeptidase [Stappia sp.]
MSLAFSRAEYAARLDRLVVRMAEEDLDAMLLFAQESMYWLTGYDTFGFCFFQSMVVTRDRDIVLLTRSADLRQAQITSIVEDIRVWEDRDGASPVLQLRDLLEGMGLKGTRLGVEYDTHGMTGRIALDMAAHLSAFASLHDHSRLVERLRAVKSPAEIALVRKAAALTDAAYEAALPLVEPGAREGEILAAMQGAVFAGDGDYPGNEFIIGSGREALLCRYQTGRRVLGENDQLTLEWAGAVRRYHVAAMRTVIVGKPAPRHVALHAAARDALEAVEETLVPGRTFGDVFAAHAAAVDARGESAHRLNACGYSLGARFAPSWMDWPMAYRDNPAVIEPDMVIFMHMILMDSDSGAAMSLGQTYLTTQGAPECLSKLPLDLPVKAG